MLALDPVSTVLVGMGLVAAVFGAVLLFATKGATRRLSGGILAGGAVVVGLGLFVTPALLATGNSSTPSAPPPTASIQVTESSTPALPTGCTLFVSTNTINCDIAYNKTSNYFAITSALGNGVNGKPVYLDLAFKIVRTDAINATFSWTSSLTSLFTANSLGATPTTYGIVGYTQATSTTPGQWQAFPDKGTNANQFSTVSAPGTNTNIESTGVPVNAFSSATVGWHLSLAGKNSTAAPESFASALSNYTAYPTVFTFPQAPASQQTWTLNWIEIGWVA